MVTKGLTVDTRKEMYKAFAASKKEEKKMTICTRNLSKKDSIVSSKKTSLSVSF